MLISDLQKFFTFSLTTALRLLSFTLNVSCFGYDPSSLDPRSSIFNEEAIGSHITNQNQPTKNKRHTTSTPETAPSPPKKPKHPETSHPKTSNTPEEQQNQTLDLLTNNPLPKYWKTASTIPPKVWKKWIKTLTLPQARQLWKWLKKHGRWLKKNGTRPGPKLQDHGQGPKQNLDQIRSPVQIVVDGDSDDNAAGGGSSSGSDGGSNDPNPSPTATNPIFVLSPDTPSTTPTSSPPSSSSSTVTAPASTSSSSPSSGAAAARNPLLLVKRGGLSGYGRWMIMVVGVILVGGGGVGGLG